MNQQIRSARSLAWEQLPIAVLALGPSDDVCLASAPACRLLWRMPAEIEGRPLAELLAPHAERLPAGLGARGADLSRTFERPLLRADGAEIWCRLTFWPVGEHGVACAIEEAARAREEKSDAGVLAALAADEPCQEAPGWLAAGLAHDLQNVLSAALLDRARSPLRGAVADRAVRLGRRLASLDRAACASELLDVNAAVRQLRGLLRAALGETRALDVDLGEEPLLVRLPPGELDRALLNLAVNARHALPDGGRLRVATSLDRGHVVVEVEDDGEGMDPGVRARALEPLFTTRGPQAGTGLGLSIVRRVAETGGGRLLLESSPGAGTRVSLRFPAVRVEAAPAASARPAPAGLPRRVLVVDDAPGLADVIAAGLADRGILAEARSDGAAALRALAGHAWDVLLVDLEMPRLGGRELAARARARHPGLRVVYMTCAGGSGGPGGRTLSKPFCLDELIDALSGGAADSRA
jgi:signal transduction histidine kinase